MKKRRIAGALLAVAMMFAGIKYIPADINPIVIETEAASKLAAPKNLKVSISGRNLRLSWSKVKGASAYRVYSNKNGKFTKLKDVKGTSLGLSDLPYGQHKFKVAALVKKNKKYYVQKVSGEVTALIAQEYYTDNITINTQSSIRIEGREAVIYFDPYKITGNPHDADVVFFTHEHYDHFSLDDIERVSKPETIYVAPKSMEGELENINIHDAILLNVGERTEIFGCPVETVASYNTDKSFHMQYKGWLGYVVTIDGLRYYIAGDTDVTPEAKTVVCDIAFVPIGGSYTMNAKEAAALINSIKPKVAIPTHYGSIVGSRRDEITFRHYVDGSISVVSKLF